MNITENKNKPLISVSLLLWQSEKFIENCLKSLFAQTYGNFELLMADNNERPDRGVAMAKQIISEHIGQRHFEFNDYNGKNIGFAPGHNNHIAKARGEYVFLLNQDVILAENFFEAALKVFAQDKKIAGVQSRCLRMKEIKGVFEKTNIIDNFGSVMLKNRRIIGRGQGQPAEEKFLTEEEIFGVDGAVPIYRKSVLEDVKIQTPTKSPPYQGGGKEGVRYEYLDEDFLSYKEDVDLAWRLRLAGWRAIYAPTVLAWHARGSGDSAATNYFKIVKERQKISDFAKKLSFRNQRLMQIKNEQWGLLLKHSLRFLTKEVAAWLYFIIFEWRNRQALGQIFKLAPKMMKKRRIIMAKRRVSTKEMERWFE